MFAGIGSPGGDFPCFPTQVVRGLGSLFSSHQGCFSLDEKSRFWFNSKSILSSTGARDTAGKAAHLPHSSVRCLSVLH